MCVIGKVNVSWTTFDQGLKFQTCTNNDSWVDRYTASVVVHACVVTSPCQLVWIQLEEVGGEAQEEEEKETLIEEEAAAMLEDEAEEKVNVDATVWGERGSGCIGPHAKAEVEAKKVAVAEVKEMEWRRRYERERERESWEATRDRGQLVKLSVKR